MISNALRERFQPGDICFADRDHLLHVFAGALNAVDVFAFNTFVEFDEEHLAFGTTWQEIQRKMAVRS
jgi:hypothetical protein